MFGLSNNVWAQARLWILKFTRSVFARQVGSTFLAQGITLIVTMGTAAITARWLGPEGKGQLAMLVLAPGMLQLLLNLGMSAANVYYAGSKRLSVGRLTANSMAFSLLGTLAGIIVFLLLLAGNVLHVLVPGVSSHYLMLGMIALPLGLLTVNLRSVLQGLRHIQTLNILSVVQAVLTLPLVALFVIGLKLGVMGALISSLGIQAVMLIVTGWCVKGEGARFRPEWNPRAIRAVLNYGLRNYVGDLLQFCNYRLDAFIVNFFLGPVGVGLYGVSVALAELLWQLPNAASFVIFPKAASSTHEDMNRFTPRVFWIVLGITSLGAVGLAAFGEMAIRFIFSSAFLKAYVPLLALLPGVVLLGAGKVLTNDIAGRGYPHYNSITAGIALVVTLVLDFVLIPRMGVVGAALASTLSYTLTCFVSIVFYRHISRRPATSISQRVPIL